MPARVRGSVFTSPSPSSRSQVNTPSAAATASSTAPHSTISNILALASAVDTDSDFEEVMRQRTKMRREQKDIAVRSGIAHPAFAIGSGCGGRIETTNKNAQVKCKLRKSLSWSNLLRIARSRKSDIWQREVDWQLSKRSGIRTFKDLSGQLKSAHLYLQSQHTLILTEFKGAIGVTPS
jgi:hypothetical protein